MNVKSEILKVNKCIVCNHLPFILPSFVSGSEGAIQGEKCWRIPARVGAKSPESGGVEAVQVICLSWHISSDSTKPGI